MNPYFSRQAIAGMREVMQNCVDVAIDRIFAEIAAYGFCNVVPLGHRMMTLVWCEVMGLPVSEADRYLGFLMRMLHSYDLRERGACALDMLEAMRKLYRANKGIEGRGLINNLSMARSMTGRSRKTKLRTSFVSCSSPASIRSAPPRPGRCSIWPGILENMRLRQDAAGIPKFIEEIFCRYDIVTTNRFVKKELTVDGMTLRAGDNVLPALPLACIDMRSFSCPMNVEPDRKEQHNAFGSAVHFCIGAALARAQLQLFFAAWCARGRLRHP